MVGKLGMFSQEMSRSRDHISEGQFQRRLMKLLEGIEHRNYYKTEFITNSLIDE